MFQLNWKIKSFFFKILNFLKLYKSLYFIQKRITKRSKVEIENIVFYWDFHLKYLRENKSKKIIEIGAGKSLAQNIYLSYMFDKKIEQTVIDVSKMIDLDLFNDANKQISKILNLKKFPNIKSVSDLKEKYNIIYLAPMSLKQVFDNNLRYDACISSTTLEHIPKVELIENFKLLKKIIEKNGIISATIDYSDHYSHTDKNISDLNYLKFSSKEWKKYNTPMLFQNRLRHQDYRKIFKSINYKIEEIKGDFGKSPKYISDEFDKNDKETFMLWGHFLLKL